MTSSAVLLSTARRTRAATAAPATVPAIRCSATARQVAQDRRLLVIEHYRNDGLLSAVVEAGNAIDGYTSVLAAGLVNRLDHAAYLGRELTRAEQALRSGARYRQDAAPGDSNHTRISRCLPRLRCLL